MGRRFEGDGEAESRWRRLSYFLRPEGELRRASTDDCGGQLGWLSLTVTRVSARSAPLDSLPASPFDLGLSRTIIVVMVQY